LPALRYCGAIKEPYGNTGSCFTIDRDPFNGIDRMRCKTAFESIEGIMRQKLKISYITL